MLLEKLKQALPPEQSSEHTIHDVIAELQPEALSQDVLFSGVARSSAFCMSRARLDTPEQPEQLVLCTRDFGWPVQLSRTWRACACPWLWAFLAHRLALTEIMTREDALEDSDSTGTPDNENSAVLAAAVLAHVGDLDSRLQLAKHQTNEIDTKMSVPVLVKH